MGSASIKTEAIRCDAELLENCTDAESWANCTEAGVVVVVVFFIAIVVRAPEGASLTSLRGNASSAVLQAPGW